MGVCLFIMLTGAHLYQIPSKQDPNYSNAINGYIKEMTLEWDMKQLISNRAYDLLTKIIKYEKYRIDIDGIISHKYIKKHK